MTWLGKGEGHGEQTRKTINGWSSTDINGAPLRIDGLSTKLTKVANYRRTICAVEAEEYLLRRINGVDDPLVAKGMKAREALLSAIAEAVSSLHQKDFETLVDVIFARSGWHRASALGGSQKLVDMVLEQQTTGERAAVQVKSAATQNILDRYIDLVDEAGIFSRFFFICHSPKGEIAPPPDRGDVHVWSGSGLATTALRLGLTDWIIDKASK